MSTKCALIALITLVACSPATAQNITVSPNIGPWQMLVGNNAVSSYLLNTATGELLFCLEDKCKPAHPAEPSSK